MKDPNDSNDDRERKDDDKKANRDALSRDENRLQAKLDGDWGSDGGQNVD